MDILTLLTCELQHATTANEQYMEVALSTINP